MDDIGFRPCLECGQRALIELHDGTGRVCGRCYVRRHRASAVALGVASEAQAKLTAPGRTSGKVRLNANRARD